MKRYLELYKDGLLISMIPGVNFKFKLAEIYGKNILEGNLSPNHWYWVIEKHEADVEKKEEAKKE